jgi:hypothetical protein
MKNGVVCIIVLTFNVCDSMQTRYKSSPCVDPHTKLQNFIYKAEPEMEKIEPETVNVNLLYPFLVPENYVTCNENIDEIIRDYRAIVDLKFEEDSLSEELVGFCDKFYDYLCADDWGSPNDVPKWAYFIIGDLCYNYTESVLKSNLSDKLVELWEYGEDTFSAKSHCVKVIGDILLRHS